MLPLRAADCTASHTLCLRCCTLLHYTADCRLYDTGVAGPQYSGTFAAVPAPSCTALRRVFRHTVPFSALYSSILNCNIVHILNCPCVSPLSCLPLFRIPSYFRYRNIGMRYSLRRERAQHTGGINSRFFSRVRYATF